MLTTSARADETEYFSAHDPQKHGNYAQWAAVVVAFFSFGLTIYYHRTSPPVSDDHINQLIAAHEKANPPVSDEHINTLIDQKLTPITQHFQN